MKELFGQLKINSLKKVANFDLSLFLDGSIPNDIFNR